jgi:hypothetical protein
MRDDMCDLHQLATPADAPCNGEAAPGDLPIQPPVGVPTAPGYLYAALASQRESASSEGSVAVYSFDFWSVK